jgi:hypothetical protein
MLISIKNKPNDKTIRHSIPLHITEQQILDALDYHIFKISFVTSKSGNKSFDIEWEDNDLVYIHIINIKPQYELHVSVV